MPFYIGTIEQCEDYNRKVSDGENYQGNTENWSVLRKHPEAEIYSVRKHWRYECSSMQSVESLPKEWNNKNV